MFSGRRLSFLGGGCVLSQGLLLALPTHARSRFLDCCLFPTTALWARCFSTNVEEKHWGQISNLFIEVAHTSSSAIAERPRCRVGWFFFISFPFPPVQRPRCRGRFRHVQHVRPNRGPTRRPANLCLGVMLTTLSLCVSCEFSRAVNQQYWQWWAKTSSVFGGKKMGGGY